MLLSDAPGLVYVIGIPFGLLLLGCVLGLATYMVLGRLSSR
jgi:hypothetical protein